MPVSRSPTRKQESGFQFKTGSAPPLSAPATQASEQNQGAASRTANHPPGIVAASLQALPIDVGTRLSPTILRPPQVTNTTCIGGPGNPVCNLEVKLNQQGVECDICCNWYHAICQDIPRVAYNALKKHEVLAFICSRCKQLPNLDKLKPKASTSDVGTQTHQDVLMVDTNIQVNNGPAQANPGDLLALSKTISLLATKVGNLEKMIKEQQIMAPGVSQQQISTERQHQHRETETHLC